jgi:hypothetical protein
MLDSGQEATFAEDRMKLFTIGDSISQGFMSGAAAHTELAYSTLIARCMGLGEEYDYPTWAAGGLPINMELILRSLEEKYGEDVNAVEWVFALRTINQIMEAAEDYYERGRRTGGGHLLPHPRGGAPYRRLHPGIQPHHKRPARREEQGARAEESSRQALPPRRHVRHPRKPRLQAQRGAGRL